MKTMDFGVAGIKGQKEDALSLLIIWLNEKKRFSFSKKTKQFGLDGTYLGLLSQKWYL